MRRSGLLALLAAAACSSVPETSYYLLTTSSPATAMGDVARATPPPGWPAERVLGLGRIEVADYLNQPGLVLETAEHQIRPATYHRWAEPLPRGIRRALLENLTAVLPGLRVENLSESTRRLDYRLDLVIERFHGTDQGTVVLGGRWSLASGDGQRQVAGEPFNYRERIASPGYLASVAVQAELLAQLSQAVASRLASTVDASG